MIEKKGDFMSRKKVEIVPTVANADSMCGAVDR